MWAILLALLRWLRVLKPAPLPLPEPGEWPDTVGAPPDEPVRAIEVARANYGETVAAPTYVEEAVRRIRQPWDRGWYQYGSRRPAHAGRIGSVIVPRCVVVHTTDMHPSDHDALVRGWTQRAGAGNCAHFLIGRTADQGIKQFAPITRNANHAGGKPHAWYRLPDGRRLHPNAVAVGIELCNAGRLRWDAANLQWVHPDTGRPIPGNQVTRAKGKGWHMPTQLQLASLRQLLLELDPCLLALPAGTVIEPTGDYGDEAVPWAAMQGTRVVGHATLDPVRKNDPGPIITEWLESYP